MLTVPSLANSPTALSLLPSVLAVTTSDIVSTRATPAALPAPLSDQPVADNAQSNTTIPAAAVVENTITATTAAAGTSGTLANNLSTGGPSSSFLAQLLGQSDEEENSVAATYARFAPAPEYNTFVGYSFIKYKPSDAGLPPQPSPLPSPITPYTAPVAPPVVTTPAVTQDNQNTTTVPVTTPTVTQNNQGATTAAVPAPVAATVTTVPTAPPAGNIPVQNTAPPPAIPAPAVSTTTASTNDFQAYSQTESRNQSNLSSAQPQFIVAG